MRSEFFNQIKKNREAYYREIQERPGDPGKNYNPFNVEEVAVLPLKMPRISMPEIHLAMPDLNRVRGLLVSAAKAIRSGWTGVAQSWKKVQKPFRERITKTSRALEQKAENWQEGFYNRVVVLFEDGNDVESRATGNPALHDPMEQVSDTSPIMEKVRRLWTGMLVSLELDEAITEIKVTQQVHDDEEQKETGQPKLIHRIKYVLNRIKVAGFKKISASLSGKLLKPIINRFIQ